MAWNGYFLLDGSEVINAQRTEEYAEHFNLGWLKELYGNRDLSVMLGDGENYTTPLVDDAPWVDPDDGDSFDFCGYYPIDVTGIEDSTAASTVVEYTGDGGSPGRLRHGTRAVVFNGILVAASTAGAEYGMRWLKQILLSGPCSGNRATLTCSGADLCYLSSDPELPESAPTTGLPTVVATNRHTNPSAEVSAAGWAAVSGSTAPVSSAEQAAVGAKSFKTVRGAGTSQLIGSNDITAMLSGAGTYRITCKVWIPSLVTGAAGVRIGGAGITTANFATSERNGWGEISFTFNWDGVGSAFLYTWDQSVTAGAYIYIDAIVLTSGAQKVEYFDGDTPDTPFYKHAWLGTPGLSASTLTYVPLIQSQGFPDCLDPYMRTLRQFSIVSPPVVGNKLQMSDGSEGWLVQFTGVAGVPFEFGSPIDVVEGYLDPDVTNPWVGDVDPGVIDFDGRIVQESPCLQQVWEPLYDPLCPAGVPPPGPVDVPMGCFTLPSNWVRRQLVIPEEMIPLWGEVVPTIAVRTRTQELRNLRLRFYADPYKVENPDIDPCGYCGDILISYIPVDATMTFDGGLQAVFVDLPGGIRRRADSLVFDTEGKPFDWPALSCGFQYVVTFDLPQTQPAPVIDLSLTPRMV